MEIGEFSSKTGLSIDTLRYYDKIGLLVPEKINRRRFYNEYDLEKAAVIIQLKNLDFSLEEIRVIFVLGDDIDEKKSLSSEEKAKIISCLGLIEEKYDCMVKKEQDILHMKAVLKRMIEKTNKLLQSNSSEKGDEYFEHD